MTYVSLPFPRKKTVLPFSLPAEPAGLCRTGGFAPADSGDKRERKTLPAKQDKNTLFCLSAAGVSQPENTPLFF